MAEVHCRRLAEGFIAAGTVMMDKIGWSSLIGVARQTE
jgi:hypothetical protein